MRTTLVVLVVGLAGCGSRSIHPVDLGSASSDLPRRDGPASRDLPPFCNKLEAYANGVTLTPLHAQDVLFLPDRRGLLLAAAKAEGTPAELTLELLDAGRTTIGSVPSLRSLEWLDLDAQRVLIVEPLSKSNPYSLSVLELGSRLIQPLAQNVCAHRVGKHGTLAFVEGCNSDWDGTLRAIFAGGSKTPVTLAKGVDASSLAISPDGKELAFLSDVKRSPAGECGSGVGALRVATGAAGGEVVAKEVLPRTVQYVAGRSLVWLSRPGCGVPGGDLFMLRRPEQAPVTIASGLSFGYAFDEDLYQVTADGRTVIAAKALSPDGAAQLVAVDLDAGAVKPIADDLFSFHMTAMAFQPWRFTPSGGDLVYTTVTGYPQMGLAALATKDWSRAPLTSALFGASWGASPEGDALAFVEGHYASPERALRIASLPPSGPGAVLATFAGDTPTPRPVFLPGLERGLLYQDRKPGGVVELRRAWRTGGETMLLGSWTTSLLRARFLEGAFRVHPSGCLVLFDSAQGTVLRSL
jgi:hypothetical protein